MRKAALLSLAAVVCWVGLVKEAAVPAAAPPLGVLILAHGGSAEWNRTVSALVAETQLPYPHAIAFGMGMHGQEVAAMQQALDQLAQAGAGRIVALPLLVCSHSEVMDQFAYLLRVKPEGPWQEYIQPLTLPAPVTLQPALDDDPVVSTVLLERARALSRTPARETVVLIAHGPVSEAHNTQWLGVMARLAARLKQEGGFNAVVPTTLRDDAPPAVREAAVQQIQTVVRTQGQDSDVLVLPLLLSKGGIEHKLPKLLQGLTYRYAGETLLPHPAFTHWLQARIASAVSAQP